MQRATKILATVLRQDRGITAIEYGLVATLVAVAMIGSVGLLGDEVSTMYSAVADAFP
jgi:pilus assembly protein Flp/PilA